MMWTPCVAFADESAQPPATADGLEVDFGRGVRLFSADKSFSLTLRGRVQLLASGSFRDDPEHPRDLGFAVRRARLLITGDLPQHDLLLYLQLGLGPSDIEGELPVPLRDWVVAWTRLPSLSLRAGQMKVPYSRERIMSSSALEFVDRTIVNAELNLDRDIGLQLYSNDLGGWDGRLAYQVGVYNGEGRNRANVGDGLLYAARVGLQPLGPFPDTLTQADLVRSEVPRLSFGLAAAAAFDVHRTRVTHGDLLDDGSWDTTHAAADVLAKWRGFSVHSEALARQVTEREAPPAGADAPFAGWGWMTQVGYVTPWYSELAVRWSDLRAAAAPDALLTYGPTVAIGHYFQDHELKLQADYGLLVEPGAPQEHQARVQLQVYF